MKITFYLRNVVEVTLVRSLLSLSYPVSSLLCSRSSVARLLWTASSVLLGTASLGFSSASSSSSEDDEDDEESESLSSSLLLESESLSLLLPLESVVKPEL